MAGNGKPKTFGIVLRESSDGQVTALGKELAQWLSSRGCSVMAEGGHAKTLGVGAATDRADLARKTQMVVVLGGDGTLLATARATAEAGPPLLGVNLGRLGFLTAVGPEEAKLILERVLQGDYEIEERTMLDVAVVRDGRPLSRHVALNDAVVDKGAIARMIRVDVLIDGKHLTEYAADGLIVSTPTGSTGYSLGAGGPLLHPALSAFVITPICPHMLSTRPIVIPDQSEVLVRLASPTQEVTLTIDGQVAVPLDPGDTVRVCRSAHKTRLVRGTDKTYYALLREKFNWNQETD